MIRRGLALGAGLLVLVLIVLGVLSRLIPHPPNMTAVVGVTLLGAYAIRNRWLAALIPLATMAIADLVLGWHSSALFTYTGMLAGTLIGRWLLQHLSVIRLGGAAFLASLAFFVISNFGVWLGGYYGYGLDGLIACYVAAIQKSENQEQVNQFTGVKAGYMIAILGNDSARDDLVAALPSITNASVRYVASLAIDRLTPKGNKAVAEKLNALITKNAKSADRDKATGDEPLKTVLYRIDARD